MLWSRRKQRSQAAFARDGFRRRLQHLHLVWIWNGGGGRGHLPNLARCGPTGWAGSRRDEPSRPDVCLHRSWFKGIEADAGRYSLCGRTGVRRNFPRGTPQLVLVWPDRLGEKHAEWRCYTPTQVVGLLERAGLRFRGAYQGLSKNRYKAEGPEVGGRLAVIAVRDK